MNNIIRTIYQVRHYIRQISCGANLSHLYIGGVVTYGISNTYLTGKKSLIRYRNVARELKAPINKFDKIAAINHGIQIELPRIVLCSIFFPFSLLCNSIIHTILVCNPDKTTLECKNMSSDVK